MLESRVRAKLRNETFFGYLKKRRRTEYGNHTKLLSAGFLAQGTFALGYKNESGKKARVGTQGFLISKSGNGQPTAKP